MNTRNFFLALAVTSTLIAGNALADDHYSFDFLASGYEVSGILTTADTLNAVNGYDILGITGSVTGVGGGVITSLVSNPGQPFPTINYGFQYDNVIYPTAAQTLDISGVLFTTVGGAIWNLWGNTPTDYQLYSYSPVAVDVRGGSMTLTAVPEPGTYAMMLAGLGLMGFVASRRKQKTA
ncbi:MAG: PEP-CTERM sorting domain-containing protein [Betaproteobacteria bacterium]